MRIQHNITALNAHRNLYNNNSSVGKNLEKLSSGYRINRAGDDAAGLAISEKMRAQVTGLNTAQKNAEDGVSLVQTAEGALTEVHSMLNRMVELSTQSANGTYSSKNREEMQKEIDQLNNEINRISETSNFNDQDLFAAAASIDLHVTEKSTGGTITVTLQQMNTTTLSTANLKVDTAANAKTAIQTAKDAIDKVSSMRSDFGALQNRLEHTINNLGVQAENLTAAESRIRDVDMAEEMVEYSKNNILAQAGQSMLAQANQSNQGVLSLLG